MDPTSQLLPVQNPPGLPDSTSQPNFEVFLEIARVVARLLAGVSLESEDTRTITNGESDLEIARVAERELGGVVIVIEAGRMAVAGASVAHMTSLAMFYLLESDENSASRHGNPNQDTIQALEALSGLLGGIVGGTTTFSTSQLFQSNNHRFLDVCVASLVACLGAMGGTIVAIGTGTSEMQAGNIGGITAVGLPLMLIYMRRQSHRGNDGTADNVLISA